MTSKRDYYEVLEITRQASPDEIKKAFRKLARQYHPDVNKEHDAEVRFKELGEAYEVLTDPQKRQIYDTHGHAGLQGRGYQPSWDFTQGFPDLSDLFAQFFGGGFSGGGQTQRGGPQRGEDLRFDLELDFMEAAFGISKEIEITHLIHCELCEGSGASPESSGPATCQTCMGQGKIRQTTQTIIGHFTQIETCPRCYGQGTVIVDPCQGCNGKGRKSEAKTITITIPAGVDTGTRLRVNGEGNAGTLKGPQGDLYVFLAVQPHAVFQRDGYDVYCSVPLSFAQLALGDEVEVPVIDGTEKIKVSAGTQHGTMFTLKHKGIGVLNGHGQRGNHHVQVVLEVPKKLSSEERKLLERLKELEHEKHAAAEAKSHGHSSFMHKFKDVLSGS